MTAQKAGAPLADAVPASAPLADARARQRIREELGTTFLVEAAAGTGKTSELVQRIVALLRTGSATLDQIVAVTFTDRAAGEMKLRLRAELERAREESQGLVHERITAALSRLEVAQIGTMHSFCADLLREWPVEARIDPGFEIAAEGADESLFEQAFDSWFETALAAPPEGLRRALRRRGFFRRPETARARLLAAAKMLSEHRDFPAPWRRDAFDRPAAMAAIVARIGDLAALGAKADDPGDYCAKTIRDIFSWFDELTRQESVRERDHDGLEADLQSLHRRIKWKWRGRGKWFCKNDGLERLAVLTRRDEVERALREFLELASADLAACLREELRPVIDAHEELKSRTGKLDFLDLLLRTRNLLAESRPVRAELQQRYSHILVDEFQDTDPLQAETLLLLACSDPAQSDGRRAQPLPGKLFVVGDPKQSIYRFRRADIAFYEDVKERLRAGGAELLELSTSFRSAPAIQAFVNAAFAPRMRANQLSSQAAYVALDPHRADPAGHPPVIALPAPRLYSQYGSITQAQIEQSYPQAVAGFVDFLIRQSGWTISEREGREPVPIEARHICLLFRRHQSFGEDLTRDYLRGLEGRRIPHVLVGGRSYFSREETQAMRVAATAIEWPDDELSVFATLRGPFFAVGDDSLLLFRERQGRLNPLRRFDEPALLAQEREVVQALAILGELHRGRNHRPIAQTLSRFLEAVRAHAGIAIWPTGEQALANVLQILEHARRFESAGARSFRSFVDLLTGEASQGSTPEAPVVEEGTDGVRVMTVHKAKGLEFPIVILCDPTAPGAPANPSRHVEPERGLWAMPLASCAPSELLEHRAEELQRDADESVRLAYVAVTRARDLLVVPATGDGEPGGWLEVLNEALYPNPAQRRTPALAAGCPPFGKETVLDRPELLQALPSVSPGQHQTRAGVKVVWWDPAPLALQREFEGGVRDLDLLVDDAGSHAAAEVTRQQHAAWQLRRADALRALSVPSLRVTTATERAAAASAPEPGGASGLGRVGGSAGARRSIETVVVPGRDPLRPRGRRFGSLVHALLASVSLEADQATIERAARLQARLLGADAAETAAGAAAVAAALRHPLLRRAAVSADLFREVPFLKSEPPDSILEGTIDLAFREESPSARWTVLEFKTDADEQAGRHDAQVELYCAAIESATGEPATGVILFV